MSGSIGEQLKQARILKGISLDQAVQATRIRSHYLEALESDNRSLLPSPVQGKGFLRLYAGYLNLEIEPLLAIWDGKEAPVSDQLPASQPPQESEPAVESVPAPVDSTDKDQNLLVNSEAGLVNETGGFQSRAIFGEIGEKLRLQRESLGLSQAEVERYTRLRQHYIQAMETGRLEDMPSPVQARGMLSNYAAFLNLDEDKIMLRFAEGLQERRIERIPKVTPVNLFSPKKKPAKQAPFWKRFLTPDLVFGVGLAAVILFFILWIAARVDTLRTGIAEPTTPAISEILLTPDPFRTTASPNSESSLSTAVSSESSGEASSTLEPPAATLPAGSQAEIATPDGQPSTAIGQPILTPTLPPMNNDPLQVYIVARQRAWLRVIADEKVKFLGRVVPGNAYAFSGEERIELLTGNAAGLQVFFNQNDLGTLGVTGEVAGMIFTQEGIFSPTLAIPPTRTPSAEATITPLPSPTQPATPTVTPFIP